MAPIPEPVAPAPGATTEAAVLAWVAARDAVLRGLTHALSNRVGTVAAVAGMLAPGEPVSGPVAAAIQDEAGRLERVLALYRLLPLDPDRPAEPLFLPDLIPTVVELHAHGGAHGDLPCAVEADPGAPPVLVSHPALAHALLVLLAAGARAAGDPVGDRADDPAADGADVPRGVRLRWTGEAAGDRVALTVEGAAAAAGAAAWLLGDAATVRADDDGAATVLLTSLAAARRAG